MAWTYDEETQVYTVPFGELDGLLKSLPVNTKDAPYKLNITELTEENLRNSSTTNTLGYVFKHNQTKFVNLEDTIIPNSVTNMIYCFVGCTSLVTVPTIPDSVTNMGWCFSGCTSLVTVPNIPNSVTYMESCFQGCTSLVTAPTIPDSVTNMYGCFYNCTSLVTAPNIPDSVTNMEGCFQGCTSLVTVPIIPDSVTDMYGCFYNCTSLVTAPNIPDSVINMGYCFSGCTSLVTVPNIPDSANMNSCFQGCTSLVTVPTIPDSVINMGYCFSGCTSLVTVPNIPNSVTYMESCFQGCTSLKEIESWNNTSNITRFSYAFYNCPSPENIYTDNLFTELKLEQFLESNKKDARIAFNIQEVVQPRDNGMPFPQLDSYLKLLPENTKDTPYRINVTELTEENMRESYEGNTLGYVLDLNNDKYVDLKETVLPSVTDMRWCFSGCTSLTTAPNIPDSVTNMEGCFQGCTSLVTVPIIPDSVTDISSCFSNCTSLTTAPNIPYSVTNMGYCFSGCTSLTTAPVIPDSVTGMRYCFQVCNLLTTAPNIPDSVTDMFSCFSGCTSLVTVPIIPDSVTDISSCFSNCTSLKEIESWNNTSNRKSLSYAFNNCSSLENIYTDNLYTELKLEQLLELNKTDARITFNIGEVVKSKSNTIKFENLRDYISTVDSNTSDTPYKLTVVDINEGDHFKDVIGESAAPYTVFLDLSDTVLPAREDYYSEFYYCLRLVKAPSIPDGTKNLAYAFSNCLSLTEVPSIPDSVENMAYTFVNCSKITQARISNNATSINSCFNNCTALINVGDIPDSVTDMRNAFSGCSALTEAKIGKNASNFMNTFRFCTSITTIDNLPAGKESYKSMFEGCTSLRTIYNFGLSYEDLSNGVYNTADIFKGCTALTNIYIDKPVLTESESWKLIRIDAENKIAKVYSTDGNIEFTVPVSANVYKKYELEGIIDEFVLAGGGDITDEIIEKFFQYQKPFTNDSSKSLNPADSNFVLWAKDKNSVVSNILTGGGGGGDNTVPIVTQKEYNQLPDYRKNDSTFREIEDAYVEDAPFVINEYHDALPIGSILEYAGENYPSGYVRCDGREVSREFFSELFDAIGIRYGEGDGTTTFNVPNITDRVCVIKAKNVEAELPDNIVVNDNQATTSNVWTAEKTKEEIEKNGGSSVQGKNNEPAYENKVIIPVNDTTEHSYICPNDGLFMFNLYALNSSSAYVKINGVTYYENKSSSANYYVTLNGQIGVRKGDVIIYKSDYVYTGYSLAQQVVFVPYLITDPPQREGIRYQVGEVDTGNTWIDGKPIYRSIIDVRKGGVGVNGATVDAPNNIDYLISTNSIGNDNNTYTSVKWNMSCTSGISSRQIYINNENKVVVAGSLYTFFVILEYTKTTDSPSL